MSKKKNRKQRKQWKQRQQHARAAPPKNNRIHQSPAILPNGSRKRTRRHVEFVYPKDSSNERRPYVFDRQSKSPPSSEQETPRKAEHSSETLDDILFSKGDKEQSSVQHIVESEVGRLSGLSVEDAVRDKAGCRPRANSTDGELNLPQRGLCDERMVLEAHRWKSSLSRGAPKGFSNLGNTCFLNATLQCLAYLPTFSQTLMSLPITTGGSNGSKPTKGQRITAILSDLFRQVHGGSGGSMGSISPRGIVNKLPTIGSGGGRRSGYNFRPGQQEDAHEFLVHLLDAMHDGELKSAGINQHSSGWRDRLPIPRLDETTFVHRLFGGYLRSQVRCTKCGYCSNTYDPFLDLSLEVSKKSSSSVASAFSQFTRQETLDSRNQWKCSGCKKHVCALKQLTVFRPPLSLCIQLKRFTFGGGGFGSFASGWGFGHYSGKGMGMSGGRGGSKISKPIEFPAELKLPLSDGRTCEYNLCGVIIHVGGSASSGHYTAYVKKPGDANKSQWYHMDDSYVQPVKEKTVLKQRDAYVLFYCRKEVKIEYPSPPPRGFESAEAAREGGIARARARSNSLDLGTSVPGTMKPTKGTIVVAAAKPTNVSKSVPVATNSRYLRKVPFADDTTERTVKLGELASSPSKESTMIRQSFDEAATRSRSEATNSSTGDDDDDNSSSSSSNSNTSTSESESDSSSSGSTSSDTSESSDEDGDDGQTTAVEPTVPTEKTSADTVATQSGDSSESSSSSNSSDSGEDNKKVAKKDSKTRVVVDHGGARGKLEVMLGPRRGSKAWKPKTASLPSLDTKRELLGSVKVGKWGDDEDGEEDSDSALDQQSRWQSDQRTNVLKQLDRQDRSRKRKMYLDRWDAMLDEGKTKKVKEKHETAPLVAVEPRKNPFHRIQSGLQRMNRGKAKGFHRRQREQQNKKNRRR